MPIRLTGQQQCILLCNKATHSLVFRMYDDIITMSQIQQIGAIDSGDYAFSGGMKYRHTHTYLSVVLVPCCAQQLYDKYAGFALLSGVVLSSSFSDFATVAWLVEGIINSLRFHVLAAVVPVAALRDE